MDRLAPLLQIAVGISFVVIPVLFVILWMTTRLGPDRTMGNQLLAGALWVLFVYAGLRMLHRGFREREARS